jgi:hypothetical protein
MNGMNSVLRNWLASLRNLLSLGFRTGVLAGPFRAKGQEIRLRAKQSVIDGV